MDREKSGHFNDLEGTYKPMSAAIDTKEKTGYESPMYAGVNGADGKNAAVVNGKSGAAMDGQNGDVSANDNQDGGKEKEKKKKEEKPPQVSVMQVFRFADGLDYLLVFLGTLGAIGSGLAQPAMMILFGSMTDSFVESAQGQLNLTAFFIEQGQTPEECFGEAFADSLNFTSNFTLAVSDPLDILEEMKIFAIYFCALGVGVIIVGYAQVTFWLMACYRQTYKLRKAVLDAILRQEIGWFDTTETAELGTRLTGDVEKIEAGIGDKLSNFIQWMSTCIAGLAVGFAYGWKLTLVILAVGPALAFCGAIMGYLNTEATASELGAYAKAGGVAEEVISSIRTVTAFSGQKKECTRYAVNLKEAQRYGVKKGFFTGAGTGVLFFIIFSCYALAFWYGAKLVREDGYTVGQLLVVFFSVLIGAFALGNAFPNLNNFTEARAAAYVLWGILDRKSLIDPSSSDGKRIQNLTGDIGFRDVVFRYPSRPDVPVLNGLTLDVRVGQTVALVGASGCGKSTTVQLVQRFYDPLEGRILLDGLDIKDLNVNWLRNQIGVVSQEPVLFNNTIRKNIEFGRDGVTEEEIIAAATMANAHEFITKLPQKYDTLVGERGAQLSGGQKQRIAITRALVRNPRILLLDEATSALDTESEASVQAALDKARQGRTTIVVAHRLSTVQNADVIVGFDGGKVAEMGSHEELMQHGGIYHTLVTNQTLAVDQANKKFTEEMEEIGLAEDEPGMLHKLNRGSSRVKPLTRGTSVTSEDTKDKEKKVPKASSGRMMKMNAPEWPYILLGLLASLVTGAVQPLIGLVFAKILGVFVECYDEQEKKVTVYSLLFFAMAVALGIAYLVQILMFSISGERLTKRLRETTFRAMLRQEISYFDDPKNSTGALTSRLATDAAAVQGATGSRLGMALSSLANIMTAVVIGFIYSWKLTLVVLAFFPFMIIAGFLQMKVMQGSTSEGKEANEETGKVAYEGISNVRTVASLTREKAFVEHYAEITLPPHKKMMFKSNVNGLAFGFSQAIIFFAYAAVFYYGATLIADEQLVYEDMFTVFAAIIFGAMAMGQAAHFAPDAGKAQEAAGRVFMLLDEVPKIDSYSQDGDQLASVDGLIQLKDVNFYYPTRATVQVLKSYSITAQPGQMVALVGTSGCGKSTTVQLLERFYDATSGSVNLDGKDLKNLNVGWLRKQIGLVQQEPILFDCSIRDNIAYGDNSREVPMAEVIEAARKANIHSFIDSLPQGYDTNVGEKGAQLSGGQKQRVAIARALIRDPKILLLDEATSALDTESEKIVQEALDRAQQGRTSIVIAHRLSTIHGADQIVVMKHGVVQEIGKHSELIAAKGMYYDLNMAQVKQ